MPPAHYWIEMLQLGGAKEIMQVDLMLFSHGPRKPQGVLATAQMHLRL